MLNKKEFLNWILKHLNILTKPSKFTIHKKNDGIIFINHAFISSKDNAPDPANQLPVIPTASLADNKYSNLEAKNLAKFINEANDISKSFLLVIE